MLSDKFIYEFTGLTILFLATYLVGIYRKVWPHIKIGITLTKILQLLISVALFSMLALLIIKMLGFTDPFPLWRGVVFTLDLALWGYICRILRKTASSPTSSIGAR
jgi:hypothetical protein